MNKVTIIAEAGVNHNGDIKLARKLAEVAKESGADIVKFQTAQLEALITRNAPTAEYQKNATKATSQRDMLRKLLLSYEDFIELSDYCREIGITFLSTPFDIQSIDFLKNIGCTMWKIPSGEITNWPYLVKIAELHQPIILSTGMSTLEEIRKTMEVLKCHGAGEITILHCTTAYPAPFKDVNLKAMTALEREFKTPVGYSDHTTGIEVSVAAVGMGASIIEKHFTLDRNMEGPDHKASLEPEELKAMVSAIRNVEQALGNGVKEPAPAEIPNIMVARKSIVAKRKILKGDIYTEENITTKRPGGGISPMYWQKVIGMKANRDYEEDEMIQL